MRALSAPTYLEARPFRKTVSSFKYTPSPPVLPSGWVHYTQPQATDYEYVRYQSAVERGTYLRRLSARCPPCPEI